MKQFYLTLSSLAFFSVVFSQPLIQSTDLNPSIGETFTMHSSNYVDPGPSGNNVVWDLSSMGIGTTYSTTFEAANSNFPSSNITMNAANQSYVYCQYNSSGQSVYGQMVGSTVITFSDAQKLIQFPINTSMNFTDAFSATFVSSGYNFVRSGSSSVSCDGYGTLTTPNGTYTNVARVKTIQNYTDVYSLGTITYSVTAYAWYLANVHLQLASVTTFNNSVQGTQSYGEYQSGTNLGVNENESNLFKIYPNPFSSEITVNNVSQVEKIEIINLNGQVEKEISSNNLTETLNLNDLNNGIYLMKIYTKNGEQILNKISKK